MSWSVSASGTINDVKQELIRQFAYPLADGPAGLSDNGEKETVMHVRETIWQVLSTFDQTKSVSVYAYGHMGYSNLEDKSGAFQQVHFGISPSG